jgi:hypothetical protein
MFRVDGRQTAPYAWGGIPVIRQGHVTDPRNLATMYGPPRDCKRKADGREQSASMYPAFGWRVLSWPR